jgi:hypothetical protein
LATCRFCKAEKDEIVFEKDFEKEKEGILAGTFICRYCFRMEVMKTILKKIESQDEKIKNQVKKVNVEFEAQVKADDIFRKLRWIQQKTGLLSRALREIK